MGSTIPNAPSGELSTPAGTEKIPVSGSQFVQILSLIIRKLRETSGPTTLSLGSITDGQYLKRSGSTVIGDSLDTDGTLAANSDSKIASQKAVKTYVDLAVTGLLDFKGATDASSNPNYPAASKGDAYVVSVAGKVGGASGKSVDIGDMYLAIADNAGGTEASVGTSWIVLEHNLAGVGLVANPLSQFAATTSAQLAGVISDETGSGLLVFATSPFLTTPQINDTSSDHQYIFAVSELAADRTVTLPLLAGNDTFVFADFIQTLTNKRITPRLVTTTQAAEPTINTDNGDIFNITALAQAITSFTTNLTGTPTAGQRMTIEITDNGTARALTWGASFASTTVTLPTTTVLSTRLRVQFEWSTVTSKWECIGKA